MKIGVIVPAAGQGKRMKKDINKQYLQLGDRPLLAHTLDIFSKNTNIEQIIAVVSEDEINYCQKNIINNYDFTEVKLVAGGETRQQSVYAGLMAFSPAINYVIIHDGARPLLSQNLLNKVIDKLKEYNAITTGVPVKDTIKTVDNNYFIKNTLKRDKLRAIQTPQAFSYELICKAHESYNGNLDATDDASLVEALGHKVKLIKGEYSNLKVTTPIDLVYAESILERK
ncbi:MAG: 2-C-methyl-D-erythritol 4-phosphate cytidylyltransferase [Halanaerobiales bacterium]